MSAWSQIKDILNKKKIVAGTELMQDVRSKASYTTLEGYIELLKSAGYIKRFYQKQYYGLTPHYKLLRKIPEKLTIDEVIQIKKRPWLIWFKHFDDKDKI